MRDDLFTVDGKPVRFWILPISERRLLEATIKEGGGVVVDEDDGKVVTLGNTKAAQAAGYTNTVYSPNLVYDTVKNDSLPDDDQVYVVQTSSPQKTQNKPATYSRGAANSSENKTPRKRRPYTEEEDERILELVLQHEEEVISGSRLYRIIAEKMDSQRSWDSIRSHFRNKILPKLSAGEIKELEKRTPSQKRTRWSGSSEQPSKSRKTKAASDHSEGERAANDSESEVEQRIDELVERRTPQRPRPRLTAKRSASNTPTRAATSAYAEFVAPGVAAPVSGSANNLLTMMCALTSRTEDVVLYALIALNGNVFDALLYLMDPEGYVERSPKDRLPWTKDDDAMIDVDRDDAPSMVMQVNRRGKDAVAKRLAFLTDRS